MDRSHDVEGTGQHFKIKGQIMYFLVNASPPKLLEVATLYLNRSHDVEGTGQCFV